VIVFAEQDHAGLTPWATATQLPAAGHTHGHASRGVHEVTPGHAGQRTVGPLAAASRLPDR
jgi:hypothetical protein